MSRAPGGGHRLSEDVVAAVDRLLAHHPRIARRHHLGLPAWYSAGAVFACATGAGLALRVEESVARTFVGADALGTFRPFGRAPLPGWVTREPVTVASLAADLPLIEEAIRRRAR